jgi:hypothetical protein
VATPASTLTTPPAPEIFTPLELLPTVDSVFSFLFA